MRIVGPVFGRCVFLSSAILAGIGNVHAQTDAARVDDALQNITALARPGKVGYAAFWDGNKYIQCRRLADQALRCEAAGDKMQPSLRNVLSGERLSRLSALGWVLDPSFGNYTQTFPAGMPSSVIAERIVQTLTSVYGADLTMLEVQTTWVVDVPCPPRNGPSQNLAGLVNEAAEMRSVALSKCAYLEAEDTPQKAASATELISIYGARVTAEVQRLRINRTRDVLAIFNAGIGYVQCMPDPQPPALYCEAQSAESWPALASILTPERLARLRAAGYAEPGRAPNYWKIYLFDKNSSADISNEILTLLYDVYGYAGATKLDIKTK